MQRHGRRALTAVVALLAGGLVLAMAGCATPEFRYVASPDDKVVFKVPRSWSTLDPKQVVPAGSQSSELSWVTFYDGSTRPNAVHAKEAIPRSPLLVAESFTLTKEQAASLTNDQLLNAFGPVTDDAQAEAKISRAAQGLPELKLRRVVSEVVTAKHAHGVHVVFIVGEGAAEVTYNQLGLVDSKSGQAHFLVISCSSDCYHANQSQIEAVARSFTVKTP